MNQTKEANAEYLGELIRDRNQVTALPAFFVHVGRLLEDEIRRVRELLFDETPKRLPELPEADGELVVETQKVLVPVKEYPDFNFVGRILGPRGMTAKKLENDTQCKIMVRGRGSIRDRRKEESMIGKPNWEHLKEDLHILISSEDTSNRNKVKLENARKEIEKLLIPTSEGDDELKRRQLIELAILNGTYRDRNHQTLTSSLINNNQLNNSPLITPNGAPPQQSIPSIKLESLNPSPSLPNNLTGTRLNSVPGITGMNCDQLLQLISNTNNNNNNHNNNNNVRGNINLLDIAKQQQSHVQNADQRTTSLLNSILGQPAILMNGQHGQPQQSLPVASSNQTTNMLNLLNSNLLHNPVLSNIFSSLAPASGIDTGNGLTSSANTNLLSNANNLASMSNNELARPIRNTSTDDNNTNTLNNVTQSLTSNIPPGNTPPTNNGGALRPFQKMQASQTRVHPYR
ncbi:hypothetical protein SNEBB_010314 [Seison nebaliae]|nr:hypothetical protein SNEBB_010314 [Seison nebaliae]